MVVVYKAICVRGTMVGSQDFSNWKLGKCVHMILFNYFMMSDLQKWRETARIIYFFRQWDC